MKTISISRLAFAGLIGIALAGCESGGAGDVGMKRQYDVTRKALESGRYDKALKGYQKLLQEPGRYEGRLRLEYAHALLRANRYQEAANEARALAGITSGPARSAALAVQATAEHELGMQTSGPASAAYLKSAQGAFAEVLAAHPEVDTIGTLRMRKTQLDGQVGG